MSCLLYTEDMDEEKAQLGKRIREAREARGLIQEDLATGLGVTEKTVGRWERGEYSPRGTTLRRLIAYFRVARDLPDLAILEAAHDAAEAVIAEDEDGEWAARERRAMELIARLRAHPDRFDIWLRDGAALLAGTA